MSKKVTGGLSIFLFFIMASGTSVSPIAAQLENPPPSTNPVASLVVESADMSGMTFGGMWVELWRDGMIVQSGWTPFTAFVQTETQYVVFIQNWEDIIFDHWEDGTTNQTRAITLTQDATLTAFFQTGTTPTNNPLVANDDFATTDEDVPITIDVMANDNFSGTGLFFVSSVTEPSNGVAVINSDNTITYTSNANFFGSDFFLYTVSDSAGLVQDSATVFVTINPVNDPPVAADDSASTTVNNPVTTDVLANDSDQDGDSLSVTSTSSPANGTATINANNTVTYSPNQNFTGNDSFTYSISDGNGGTDSAVVFVTVHKPLKIISTINLGSSPFDIEVNAVTNKIYATHYSTASISVIDGSTDTISDTIFTGNTTNPAGVGVNPNTNRIYVGDARHFSLLVIDGATDTITSTIPNANTWRVAVNPNTNKIYTSGVGSGLFVIDGSTNTVIKVLLQNDGACGSADNNLAVNPVTNIVYQICAQQAFRTFPGDLSVIIIDGSTDTVIGSIDLRDGIGGGGKIAVNPNTNTIYVTDFFGRTVFVIDGNTNTVVTEVPLGIVVQATKDLAVNERTDMIYVIISENDTVSAIDGKTNQVIDTILVDDDPNKIAVNPETNKVYVGHITVLQGIER